MKDRIKFYQSQIKSLIKNYKEKFNELSQLKKITSFAIILLVFTVFTLFLNRDKPELLRDHADEIFTFDKTKGIKPYTNFFPSIGEELLLDKIIVNLKQTQKHPHAMGMFEIFLNVSNIEYIQNIKEKEYLIQDVLQRELEGFSYENLSKSKAKTVLKVILKNKMNNTLGQKMIKKLYFKTFVIQP